MSSKSCFLIENPLDLFYLTRLKLSAGHLLVAPFETALFVDGRYIEVAQKNSKQMRVLLANDKEQKLFVKEQGVTEIFFDSAKTSCEKFWQLEKLYDLPLKPRPGLVKKLRAIKTKEEIAKLEKSASLAYAGYQHILGKLKAGVTEKELALFFKIFCLEKGAETVSFEPIIAFGKNSALPHHQSGETKLKRGDTLLLDLGTQLEGYASDMTRTHFFGRPDPELYRLYQVVRASQKAALALCKPGRKIGDLDKAARKKMAEAGVESLFVHSLGHGIGLEVHEFPLIKQKGPDALSFLQEGMAITIEPGLYLTGKGGIRYEDTILITPSGFRNLYPQDSPCEV